MLVTRNTNFKTEEWKRESHLLSGYCLVICIKSQSKKTDNQAPPTGRQHLNYDIVIRTTGKQSNIYINDPYENKILES